MFYLLNIVVNKKMTPLHIIILLVLHWEFVVYNLYFFQKASVQTCNMLLVVDMTLKSNIIYDIDHST